MRRVTSLALALAVVTFTAAGASAQNSPIVPGRSIGSFAIGQDLTGIVSTLGPLHSQDDLPGRPFIGYFWPLKRIGVIVDRSNQKVVALAISLDEGYQTDKGVSAGSEMDIVRGAYGPEDSVENHDDDDTLVYNKLGVAFVVDKGGALGSRVSLILVFTSGRFAEIFKGE